MTVLINNGQQKLDTAIRHAINIFLKEEDFIRGIFIKPNIVFPVRPESGEISQPLLVQTLISALRERYANIDIILGEGVAAGCDPEENFKVSGYAGLAEELNIPLLDLHRAKRKAIPWKFGKLELPCIAFDRTYINLPILKQSSACVISGALKNQKGLVAPEMKKHFHRLGLHEQVAELNAIVKPTLTILDCSHFFGRNTLISGDNCGEIDATACQLLGIDEPEHVKFARDAKVFASGYPVIGNTLNVKRIAARPVVKEFKRLGRLRLWSNSQACTMCRYLLQNIRQNPIKRQNALAGMKLFRYALQGAEIVMGSNPHWRKEYQTVICIGACTYRVAKEGGCIYIPGCPPTAEDLYKHLP